jgi:hypothetical protein
MRGPTSDVPSRREVVKHLLAAGSLAAVPSLAVSDTLSLGTRAHFTAKPAVQDKLTSCFSTVLRCGPPLVVNAPGVAGPILAFRFPNGGSVSVELSDDALDEHLARRGAWLEIQTDDVDTLKRRILDAGLEQIEYPATTTFYFFAPGGQVFGIVDPRHFATELRKP